MSLILSIDTSGTNGTVMLQHADAELAQLINDNPADHSAFLPGAINGVLQQAQVKLARIDAVAVCAGPGSYTGIRVAVAAAKGLCFGADKPLIMVTSLELLVQEQLCHHHLNARYVCPMIDARRNEVFCALYNVLGEQLEEATAKVVDESFYNNYERSEMIFTGTGAAKALQLDGVQQQMIISPQTTSSAMREISWRKFQQKQFTDVGQAKPLYAKAFYNTQQINRK